MPSERSMGRVITAMVTPFDHGGNVSVDGTRRLARHLVNLGSDGIVVAGTTGESPALSLKERSVLLETVLEEAGQEVFVWAGTGSYDHRATVQMTREAERAGAHGIMVVTPYYNKPSQEGLYVHFSKTAEVTDLPVMVYNVPGRTGVNMSPETFRRLAENCPNIKAIKEASGSADQVSEIASLTEELPSAPAIYSGDDSMTLPLMALGGQGVVSVASHLVAGQIQAMVSAFSRGEIAGALRIHIRLFPLFKALFVTSNPSPVKAALNWMGLDVGGLRLPLVEPSLADLEILHSALKGVGLAPGAWRLEDKEADGI